eukprot:5711977-Prymnesium_polylepis.1
MTSPLRRGWKSTCNGSTFLSFLHGCRTSSCRRLVLDHIAGASNLSVHACNTSSDKAHPVRCAGDYCSALAGPLCFLALLLAAAFAGSSHEIASRMQPSSHPEPFALQ